MRMNRSRSCMLRKLYQFFLRVKPEDLLREGIEPKRAIYPSGSGLTPTPSSKRPSPLHTERSDVVVDMGRSAAYTLRQIF